MSARERASSLGALSKKWMNRDFPYRRRALERLVTRSGFSKRMAGEILDGLFSELKEAGLWRLLRAELKDPAVLDGFVKDRPASRLVRARGPRTILHVFPANIPNAAVMGLVTGLLLGSWNIAKVSRRDEGILPLYLASLKSHDKALWKTCLLIRSRVEAVAWAKKAELAVAYGEDRSLVEIRRHLPAKTPFVAYGSRVSLALVLREALSKKNAVLLAKKTALDVWRMDQRGCLSPVLVFAQKGGTVSAKDFAKLLAQELERLEKSEDSKPRRGLSQSLAARRLHDALQLQLLKGAAAAFWKSGDGLWAVGYDEKIDGEYASGAQVIRVKGFGKLSELEETFQRMSGALQAVSLECTASHRKKLAEWLSVFGVNRICRAGKLQKPPVTWHHDGRLNLANWLTWTDLER